MRRRPCTICQILKYLLYNIVDRFIAESFYWLSVMLRLCCIEIFFQAISNKTAFIQCCLNFVERQDICQFSMVQSILVENIW